MHSKDKIQSRITFTISKSAEKPFKEEKRWWGVIVIATLFQIWVFCRHFLKLVDMQLPTFSVTGTGFVAKCVVAIVTKITTPPVLQVVVEVVAPITTITDPLCWVVFFNRKVA